MWNQPSFRKIPKKNVSGQCFWVSSRTVMLFSVFMLLKAEKLWVRLGVFGWYSSVKSSNCSSVWAVELSFFTSFLLTFPLWRRTARLISSGRGLDCERIPETTARVLHPSAFGSSPRCAPVLKWKYTSCQHGPQQLRLAHSFAASPPLHFHFLLVGRVERDWWKASSPTWASSSLKCYKCCQKNMASTFLSSPRVTDPPAPRTSNKPGVVFPTWKTPVRLQRQP